MKLGKDGRKLSKYQSPSWMEYIAKKRKYLNQPKGEKHWCAKLHPGLVFIIRHPNKMPRRLAQHYSDLYGISQGYVYHIRARKTWKWL